MFEWLTTRSIPSMQDDEGASARVAKRLDRARRLAEQPWREFLKDLAVRVAFILGGVAIAALLLRMLAS